MATHIIGDVHGCYAEMCELLDQLAPASDDRVVFIGDLVVRGPENAEVVRFVAEPALPNITVIRGNNEAKLRPTLEGDPTYATPAVLAAIEQLRAAGLLDDALALFESFPYYVDLGETAIVHAGVRPGVPLAEQRPEDLLKIKTVDGTLDGPMWYERYEGPQRVVFGHHVFRDPLVTDYVVGIDTGCVYGGRLSALTVETGLVTSVKARETYYFHPSKYYLFE